MKAVLGGTKHPDQCLLEVGSKKSYRCHFMLTTVHYVDDVIAFN